MAAHKIFRVATHWASTIDVATFGYGPTILLPRMGSQVSGRGHVIFVGPYTPGHSQVPGRAHFYAPSAHKTFRVRVLVRAKFFEIFLQ
jgi:hypothetical protein